MRESLRSRLACLSLFICFSLGTAIASEPVAADTTAAPADEPPSPSALERGHQLLADQRYDEAIIACGAAHKEEPTAQSHVALALAKLRGRRVLQPGEKCDLHMYRAELDAHLEESIRESAVCRRVAYQHSTVKLRQRELAAAIEHLESAAALEPDNLQTHQLSVAAKIALSQFEEEAYLRAESREVEYALGHNRNLELPSLSFFSNAMYPLEPEE